MKQYQITGRAFFKLQTEYIGAFLETSLYKKDKAADTQNIGNGIR